MKPLKGVLVEANKTFYVLHRGRREVAFGYKPTTKDAINYIERFYGGVNITNIRGSDMDIAIDEGKH